MRELSDAILDAVTEAVLHSAITELPDMQRITLANLVRRDVARGLPEHLKLIAGDQLTALSQSPPESPEV